MSRRLVLGAIFMAVLTDFATACVTRVVVRPVGVITSDDPVSLELQIVTSTSPGNLTEPTTVNVVGFDIFVDVHPAGGPFDSPDSFIESVDLGKLAPGIYTFEVQQPGNIDCVAFTHSGSFCVQDAACNQLACQCPVPYPKYMIVDLGTLGGGISVGLAINDLGQVVGGSDTSKGERHAFLWDNGVMTDLGTVPNIQQSEAWDINNLGQVVGIANNAGLIHAAFLWENGQMNEIGDPVIPKSAFGINDAGQIVGTFVVPAGGGKRHAFLWENDVMTDLTALGFLTGIAWDINIQGAVVGGCCMWQDGTATNLGALGGNATGAQGLNDNLQVVGKSERVPGKLFFHAFRWQEGVMTDLGALGGFESSTATAINDAGQIVGGGGFGKVAGSFLFDPKEGFAFFENLLPVDSGWSELFVRDINNSGQIVGTGTFNGLRRAFLMTPAPAIPAASDYGMIAMAILILAIGIVVIVRAGRRTPGGTITNHIAADG